MITHMQAQGLTTTDLRSQAAEVLTHLSEDQLLEVLAFARSLEGAVIHRSGHALEGLLDEDVH
jgi:hypothetical protein